MAWASAAKSALGPLPSPFDTFMERLGAVGRAARASATSSTTPEATTNSSAKGLISDRLAGYGLSGLTDMVWNLYLNGTPEEEIWAEIRKTPEHKARFVGYEDLVKKGRAIDEGTYINLERAYTQIFRAAGLPSGFYDSPDDFGRLIGGEVAPTELADRVNAYKVVLYQSPRDVRYQLQRLYGVDPGEMLAMMIDPNIAEPLIQQRVAAARLSSAASRTGFGQLNQTEAERLAQVGVTDDQAVQGFGTLAGNAELFSPLDQGEQAIGRRDQLAAAFEGDSGAQRRIENQRRRRQAQFQGGGSYAGNQRGLTGLGSAAS